MPENATWGSQNSRNPIKGGGGIARLGMIPEWQNSHRGMGIEIPSRGGYNTPGHLGMNAIWGSQNGRNPIKGGGITRLRMPFGDPRMAEIPSKGGYNTLNLGMSKWQKSHQGGGYNKDPRMAEIPSRGGYNTPECHLGTRMAGQGGGVPENATWGWQKSHQGGGGYSTPGNDPRGGIACLRMPSGDPRMAEFPQGGGGYITLKLSAAMCCLVTGEAGWAGKRREEVCGDGKGVGRGGGCG